MHPCAQSGAETEISKWGMLLAWEVAKERLVRSFTSPPASIPDKVVAPEPYCPDFPWLFQFLANFKKSQSILLELVQALEKRVRFISSRQVVNRSGSKKRKKGVHQMQRNGHAGKRLLSSSKYQISKD